MKHNIFIEIYLERCERQRKHRFKRDHGFLWKRQANKLKDKHVRYMFKEEQESEEQHLLVPTFTVKIYLKIASATFAIDISNNFRAKSHSHFKMRIKSFAFLATRLWLPEKLIFVHLDFTEDT